MIENEAKIGQRVMMKPQIWDPIKKEWTFENNDKAPCYGYVGTIRSLGVIPTVKVLANTNAGYVWYGCNYDEMESVSEDTPLTVLWR